MEILKAIHFLDELSEEIMDQLKPYRLGLQSFTPDYLYQYFLLLMGMLYHHLSLDGSEEDLIQAKSYYL